MWEDFDSRPARRQTAAGPQRQKPPPGGGTTYNIWYHKWSGGENRKEPRTHAEARVDVRRDSGATRASKGNQPAFFCLQFARSCCPRGPDCTYLHRIPRATDQGETTRDCFGRERHEELRDDMGGVGSFSSESRTLYVNRIHPVGDIKEKIERHFGEFGTLEHVHVLRDKAVAFVTYENRANAEFAKEAMSDQSLDHNEILNVRWASEDPNPAAQARKRQRAVEQVVEHVRQKQQRLDDTAARTKANSVRVTVPALDERAAAAGCYANPGYPPPQAPGLPVAGAPYAILPCAGSSLAEHVAGALSQVNVKARTAPLQNETNSGPQGLSALMSIYGDTSSETEEDDEEEKDEKGEKDEKDNRKEG